jgi:hypothetical protein
LKVIQLLRSSPFGIEGSYLLCFRFQLFKPSLPIPTAEFRIINIRKPSQPDDEQKRVYQMLGIDWKSAYPTRKTEIPA